MDLLIYAIIVIVVCCFAIYGVGLIPLSPPVRGLLQGLIAILGALVVGARAGLF